MGSDKKPEESRSKFTPTADEQGSAAVQPARHRENNDEDTGARQQLERDEQHGSQKTPEQNDTELDDQEDRADDTPGLFSALVGDGKEP